MGKTLIVCEKPSAAARMADALAGKRLKKRELNGVPYYEFERDGKEIVVVPALGHLFTLKNLRPMRDYPVYDIDWVPIYQADRKSERAKQFVEAIKKLALGADEWISATDYDVEGAVIAYNILKYLCGKEAIEQAKRMKFSTLTIQDLHDSYENILPRLDLEQINAGLARHVLDWYWGQNISKAMSASVEAAHQRFAKLSAGRVQTPSVDGEEEVFIRDEKGCSKIVKLGALVDKLLKKNVAVKKYGCEITRVNSLHTLAFDPDTLKIDFHPLEEVARHPVAGKLVEIELEGGRKIKVTQNHSVFTLNGTSIVEAEAGTIKRGDYLVCPRRIKLPPSVSEKNLLDEFSIFPSHLKKSLQLTNVKFLGKYPRNLGYKKMRLTTKGRLYIRERRENLGLSSSDIGFPSSTVSQWETGRNNPRLRPFVLYLKKLGISPQDFIFNESYVKNITTGTIPLSEYCSYMKLTRSTYIRSSGGWRLPIILKITGELMRLLGYYISEGNISPGGLAITFGVHEKKLIEDATRCIRTVFKKSPTLKTDRPNIVTILFGGKVARVLFGHLGATGNARTKKVPWIVFNAENGLRLEFLRGLFEGDGCYDNRSGLALSTASPRLASEVMYLLLGSDVIAHNTVNHSKNRLSPRPINRVWVCGKKDLSKIWEAIPSRCREDVLNHLKSPTIKTVVGGIPVEILKTLNPPRIDHWKERISVRHANNMLDKIRNKDEGALNNCRKLVNSDLAFLKVLRIRKVPPSKKYAYDLSVEGAHNFICGFGGVCAHNTLKILAEREREIKAFKPEPFWVLGLLLELDGVEAIAEHAIPQFFDKVEAERAFNECKDKPARVAAIQTRQYRRTPPVPFDLGLLQYEAYRCFGYTPMRTQQIAQALYQAALISYPRTSSQKLPATIGYGQIIKRLGEISKYKKLAQNLLRLPELKPHEGPKEDPAHPCLYPTGEKPEELTGPQQKLYDLIVRRFFATFAPSARIEGVRVELDVGGEPFLLRGRRVLERGWLEYYPYAETEEITLPELCEGQLLNVKKVLFEEKETQPPPRYNPASIIKELEARSLGTKATRAFILQNVYERGYIFGNQIEVSELGVEIIDALSKYCPEIVSEELTASFEREMQAIQESRRNKEEVIEEAKMKLNGILEKFRRHEIEIGKELGEAYKRTKQLQRVLGKCSKCGGELRMIVSRRTHKRFAGCSNYSKGCTNSYPLPQFGAIISLGKTCEQCGAPMIQVNRMGMRPYRMCLDPKCPSKADWGKRKAGQLPKAT